MRSSRIPCPTNRVSRRRRTISTAQGRPQTALCAVELRCPEPYTVSGFGAFNARVSRLLDCWGVFVDGQNPIGRSNIAPVVNPPTETLLYAFSYTAPTAATGPSFVVSGAPEKADVRPGEASPEALQEKTASVMQAMHASLAALATDWSTVTALNLYTQHDLHAILPAEILAAMGPAAMHGIHWYYSRPPVIGLEVEADVRAIRQEIRLF